MKARARRGEKSEEEREKRERESAASIDDDEKKKKRAPWARFDRFPAAFRPRHHRLELKRTRVCRFANGWSRSEAVRGGREDTLVTDEKKKRKKGKKRARERAMRVGCCCCCSTAAENIHRACSFFFFLFSQGSENPARATVPLPLLLVLEDTEHLRVGLDERGECIGEDALHGCCFFCSGKKGIDFFVCVDGCAMVEEKKER